MPEMRRGLRYNTMKKLILASASPRRKELLKALGLKFRVLPSHIPEDTQHTKPRNIVMELALKKAEATARKLRDGVVIGADTIVVLNGDIIGKPKDKKDARRILKLLSGSYHRVYSGIAVIDAWSGAAEIAFEISKVKMRKINGRELERLSGKHLDKAGAYAVQEKDDAFVERIEGDYFNVVGLPVKLLCGVLKKFGVKANPSSLSRPDKL
jgi:septum formation protein